MITRPKFAFAYAFALSFGIILAYGLLWTYFISHATPGPFQGIALITSGLWLIFLMSFIWKLFEPSMWTFRDMIRNLNKRTPKFP